WSGHQEHRVQMDAQWALGDGLRRGLLREVLGENHDVIFGSETLFGPLNHRFRTRLPYVLAFGYQLGSTLHALVGDDPPAAQRSGERCAIFNLGISVFDLVCDTAPSLRRKLGDVFDENVLRNLMADAGSAQELDRVADGVDCAELSFLLCLIAAFFKLATRGETAGSPPELAN